MTTPAMGAASPSGRSAARNRILLAGQHPLLLEAVERLLGDRGFVVVGRAASILEALRLLAERTTDVVVLDLEMPEAEAVAWLRRLRSSHGRTPIVALTESSDERRIQTALDEGAHACVLKAADPADLVTAVRQALHQSLFLPGTRAQLGGEADSTELTPRELEVLQLVAEGASNAEVARRLWVTEQTVKFHLSNVYRKLDVSNRTEASRWAQVRGVLKDDVSRA